MDVKRHICILCKRKKSASKMVKVRSHWTCNDCLTSSRALPGETPGIRVLNLYAGIGGNRKKWTGCHVTAVEKDIKVAAKYKQLYPDDTIVVGDAHEYLIKNFFRFDFIWSSNPCQSHTRMNYLTPVDKKKYADMSIYQEILLLRAFFKGKFVFENVVSYYTPLIPPTHQIGRHCFWSNFNISPFEIDNEAVIKHRFSERSNKDDVQRLSAWLGIPYEEKIYINGGQSNYTQVIRNCVHPDIGLSVFNDFLKSLQPADLPVTSQF